MKKTEIKDILMEEPKFQEMVKELRKQGKTDDYIKIHVGHAMIEERVHRMTDNGCTTVEIAKELDLPESTVRAYIK